MLFFLSFFWAMMIYSLCRLQFLLWNFDFYSQQKLTELLMAFFYGLRFDLTAVAIVSVIPLAFYLLLRLLHVPGAQKTWQKSWALLFAAFHLPGLFANLGDAEFIHFLGRRYTYDALFFLAEVPGKFFDLVASYWLLNFINLAVMSLFVVGLWLLAGRLSEQRLPSKRGLGFALMGLSVILIAARGGLQSKPINFAHAQIFAQPMMNSLVMNSAFTLLQTIKRASLNREHFMDQTAMLAAIEKGRHDSAVREKQPALQKPNIVLIILESFSYEFFKKSGYSPGYAPFIESLGERGVFFENAYANARRSIEGIGAIIGGIPALMNEPFISSQYLTNHFRGLGTELSSFGYHTSFFHGAQNGSMYFDQFMKSAGVKNYYGKDQYPRHEDDDGVWGIWDEPFLQFAAAEMNQFPQPFFSTIFTLSSHHPYKVPAQLAGRFPPGTHEIHPVLGYTDFAVEKFFATAQTTAWYKNTIFIITADHTYRPLHADLQNEIGHYRIPLIIFSPGHVLPKMDSRSLAQHIDIMPTILDLVGRQTGEANLLGASLLRPATRFVVNQNEGRYFLIEGEQFVTYQKDQPAQLFWLTDQQQKQAIENAEVRRADLENRLKAVIQYFSQGMWDNKLYYPTGR